MTLFDTLGFKWDRASVPQIVPRGSIDRAVFRFRRILPEYVWDAGVLEGNPFTFPEVKTLLEGVTVGGRHREGRGLSHCSLGLAAIGVAQRRGQEIQALAEHGVGNRERRQQAHDVRRRAA